MDALTTLLTSLAAQGPRVVELQTALTALQGLGPDNDGPGELNKVEQIARWLTACGITDQQRVDAPDDRVPGGLRPNLIARVPGRTSRTLWLFGHTDVVPAGDLSAWASDPWQVRQEGDWLYGRGVEDNQQAIVSSLLLAEALQREKIVPPMTLGMVFMADEETGSHYGLDHVLRTAPQLFHADDLYIVPDAGAPDATMLEVAEKGQLWLKITTTGQQCHASTPQKGRNAHLAGAEMLVRGHEALTSRFSAQNALFSPSASTFVPSKHEANVPAINILPGKDVFYLDCRLLPGLSPQDVVETLQAVARDVADRHHVYISVDTEQMQEATATPADSPVVLALQKAVRAVYGTEARPVGIGGATVAAFLRQRGLPAAVWACIQNTCHQPDEKASITAAWKDAQVFARILMA